jgi:predicted nucleic acid-binding protein
VRDVAPRREIDAWDLGSGETAVLSLALSEPGWTAVLDDRAARNCAKSFDLPTRGTLGVIILARQRGIIPSAAAAMRRLQAAGLRLHPEVFPEALAQSVGERWEA